MSEAMLQVRDVRVAYPGRRGAPPLVSVDGVSLDIDAGGALALIGESGCGKTSLARAVLGLVEASGSIRFEGRELCGLRGSAWGPVRRGVQAVFQDPYASLDPRMNVAQILCEPLDVHGVATRRERLARALALMDAVGLEPAHLARYPHEFSGGQRQRIAIARALMMEPRLVVLDEPVSALDVSVRAQVVQLLRDLRERFGLAYLVIAHDLPLLRLLCEDFAVMYLGRVVERAPRDALFAAPLHPYTRALLDSVPIPDPVRARLAAHRAPPGDVPSPADPPSGCRFHPRCGERARVAEERCRRLDPALRRAGAEYESEVACHLFTPASAQP